MKRLLLACLFVVCTSVVAATDVGPIDNNVGLPDEDTSGSGRLHAVNVAELLFFNIEGLAAGELELRFLSNGELLLTERLQISDVVDNGGGPPAVGVLAAHPAELHLLHSMQPQIGGTLNIEVWSNGRYIMTLSFEELVTDSARLLQEPFQPQAVEGVVSGPGKVQRHPRRDPFASMKATCEDRCEIEFDECMATTCPGQETCEECEGPYFDCLDDCDPPDPCPSSVVYYWTSWYPISSYTYYYMWCFEYPMFSGNGRWYDEVHVLWRRDYIKKTTINCSTTYQIISYQYMETTCNQLTWTPCYSPFFPFNTCY
jgi:hypothetical protein